MIELTPVFYKNDLPSNVVSLLLSEASKTEDHYQGVSLAISLSFPLSSFIDFYLTTDLSSPLRPQVINFLNSGDSARSLHASVEGGN